MKKLTFKQKVAVFVAIGAVMTALSAAGTVFGVKKHKASKSAK